jgi:hypothetical protein
VVVKEGQPWRPGKEIRNITRKVCERRWNNGWMSRLETAAIPVLTPLILGQRRGLSPDDCRVLARWATKTHMTQELTGSRQWTLSPQSQRSWMADEHTDPPEGVHVWVAAYYSPTPEGHYDLTPLTRAGDGQVVDIDSPGAFEVVDGYRATLLAGRLLIAVASLYRVEGWQLNYSIQLPVIRVWPPTGRGIIWPPPEAQFSHDSIELFKEARLGAIPKTS